MSTALETGVGPMDLRAIHERMGHVYHQPVRVHSFTNKRFTVNFRVPLDQLRRIVPERVEEEAKQFAFDLDGSGGYDYGRGMLSFQKIDYPPWDMYFCHESSYHFPLIDYLHDTFGLDTELDCVLFMRNTPQTWGASWLYRDGRSDG